MKRFLVLLVAMTWASSVWAVDRDDIFASIYGGTRLDRNLQGGIGIGYAPVNGIGFGVLLDETSFSTQGTVEGRWFLEPFEIAAAIGAAKNHSRGSDHTTRLAILAEANYLFALTPSLAMKVIARPQFLINGTSSFLMAAGLRLVL